MCLELNLDQATLPHSVWGEGEHCPGRRGMLGRPPAHVTLQEADGTAEETEHGARGPGGQGGQGGARGWRAEGSGGRGDSRRLSPASPSGYKPFKAGV